MTFLNTKSVQESKVNQTKQHNVRKYSKNKTLKLSTNLIEDTDLGFHANYQFTNLGFA